MIQLGIAIVRGRSMLPTLTEGDRLLVAYGVRPRPGRVVLCDLPADAHGVARPLSVKRLTGPAPRGGSTAGPPEWWVESDNRGEGVDSWSVGALPDAAIRAVVLARLPRRIAWGRRRS